VAPDNLHGEDRVATVEGATVGGRPAVGRISYAHLLRCVAVQGHDLHRYLLKREGPGLQWLGSVHRFLGQREFGLQVGEGHRASVEEERFQQGLRGEGALERWGKDGDTVAPGDPRGPAEVIRVAVREKHPAEFRPQAGEPAHCSAGDGRFQPGIHHEGPVALHNEADVGSAGQCEGVVPEVNPPIVGHRTVSPYRRPTYPGPALIVDREDHNIGHPQSGPEIESDRRVKMVQDQRQ